MSDLLFVLDVETTGLDPETCGVVSIGAVAVREGVIVSVFQTLVWPGREYLQPQHRECLARVSGIRVEALLGAGTPTTPDARDSLTRWMCEEAGAPSAKVLYSVTNQYAEGRTPIPATSYNLQFDRAFLDWLCLPWSVATCYHAELDWQPCLMEMATADMAAKGLLEWHKDRGKWRWPNLATAAAHYGVPLPRAHDALEDAKAAAGIWIALQQLGEGARELAEAR